MFYYIEKKTFRNNCFNIIIIQLTCYTGFSTCEICPSGYECPSGDTLVECKAGFFSAAGLQTCKACLVGHYTVNAASESCQPCPPGHMCPEPSKSPSICPYGYVTSCGNVTCHACPNNQVSNDEHTECLPCPAGFACSESRLLQQVFLIINILYELEL